MPHRKNILKKLIFPLNNREFMSRKQWAALIAIGVGISFVVYYNIVMYNAIVAR
jgi:hypothetical protein